MFIAHLSDAINGESTKTAATEKEAVELAFRELAERWMHPAEVAAWPSDTPMFDGEIRGIEVWWHNRTWTMIGTVQPA